MLQVHKVLKVLTDHRQQVLKELKVRQDRFLLDHKVLKVHRVALEYRVHKVLKEQVVLKVDKELKELKVLQDLWVLYQELRVVRELKGHKVL